MRSRILVALLTGLIAIACVPDPLGGAPSSAGVDGIAPSGSPDPGQPSTPPGPTPTPSFVRPTPLPSPTFLAYEVRAGDTLTSIARDFGTTARSIAYWNRVAYPSLDPDSPSYEPGLIKVGWTLLLIPTAVVDEDELPELTPSPTISPAASPTVGPTSSPAAVS